MEKKIRNYTYGYFYAILAAFLYSMVSVVAKGLVSDGIHPVQVTFYQYLFTITILGIWNMLRNPGAMRCSMKQIGTFALLGVIGGACTNILFYSALQYLDAGISSMLLFLHPVFITIFFAVTKIKKLHLINYLSVLMAAVGAAIVLNVFTGHMTFSAAGIGLGIISALTYAFYNVFADLKLKEEEPNVINFYACAASMLFTAAILGIKGIGFAVEPSSLPTIFFIAAFSGVLPAYFFFKALQYIGSEKVSVISSVELPLTLLLAFAVLREHMELIQLLGIAFIVTATVLLHRNERQEDKVKL